MSADMQEPIRVKARANQVDTSSPELLLCNCDGFWHVSVSDDSDMLNTTHYIGNMEEAVMQYIQSQAEGSDLVAKHPDICTDVHQSAQSPPTQAPTKVNKETS